MIKVSLFAEQERETKMDKIGDALGKLAEHVDFAALAAEIDEAAPRPGRERGGRPPFPTELMVRVLVVQQLYNISDEQMEFQLLDRLSFQRFVGLRQSSQAPNRAVVTASSGHSSSNSTSPSAAEPCAATRIRPHRLRRPRHRLGRRLPSPRLHAGRYRIAGASPRAICSSSPRSSPTLPRMRSGAEPWHVPRPGTRRGSGVDAHDHSKRNAAVGRSARFSKGQCHCAAAAP